MIDRDDPAQTMGSVMGWLFLFVAGILEVGWAVGLKHMEGGIRPIAAALTAAAMVGSLALLALALRTIPLGTAYAIWTGIGVIGTVAVGVLAYDEPLGVMRLLSLTLIVIGIGGVKFASA